MHTGTCGVVNGTSYEFFNADYGNDQVWAYKSVDFTAAGALGADLSGELLITTEGSSINTFAFNGSKVSNALFDSGPGGTGGIDSEGSNFVQPLRNACTATVSNSGTMEGNLPISPGDTLQGGYDFTIPGLQAG